MLAGKKSVPVGWKTRTSSVYFDPSREEVWPSLFSLSLYRQLVLLFITTVLKWVLFVCFLKNAIHCTG